ncbi:MAG: YfcE family phosphodiesterase [Clostridiales bacterium]|nr:YfcE family phosphodiesterase [Clostridiales bacterium]
MSRNVKLTVFSDTHGNVGAIRSALAEINSSDYFVFLGDGYRDLCRVQDEITVPTIAVCGNCDLFCPLPSQEVITAGGCSILVTHGNAHGVKSSLLSLAAYAAQNDCAYVLYGHTHRALIREINGVVTINPGSASGKGSRASYAVVEGTNGSFGAKILYV